MGKSGTMDYLNHGFFKFWCAWVRKAYRISGVFLRFWFNRSLKRPSLWKIVDQTCRVYPLHKPKWQTSRLTSVRLRANPNRQQVLTSKTEVCQFQIPITWQYSTCSPSLLFQVLTRRRCPVSWILNVHDIFLSKEQDKITATQQSG